mgnify:CR=1 FL=1
MLTEEFMFAALGQAMLARDHGEVPVGAVIVKNSEIIGMGFNTVIKDQSVSSHAEINAINDAGRVLKNYRLLNCDLYVTLEPCHMCAKAIVDARIKKVIFAAPEPKTGSFQLYSLATPNGQLGCCSDSFLVPVIPALCSHLCAQR